MNRALPDAKHNAPEDLVGQMPFKEKGRHVLALAMHIGAPIIVTPNLRDFPDSACGQFGIASIPPDEFLAGLATHDLIGAIAEMSSRRRRPPRTPDEIVERLASVLPLTVASIRSHG